MSKGENKALRDAQRRQRKMADMQDTHDIERRRAHQQMVNEGDIVRGRGGRGSGSRQEVIGLRPRGNNEERPWVDSEMHRGE